MGRKRRQEAGSKERNAQRGNKSFRNGRVVYIYKKKTNQIRVWTAVDRNRLKFADFVVGEASKEVCKSLLDKLKKCTIDIICTDGNYAYDQCIPRSIEHVITKSETCLVEAFNSVLRDELARLHHKTKGYSKSAEMLRLSVLLLFYDFNSIPR